jgi:phage major head subunit gpT-like protein
MSTFGDLDDVTGDKEYKYGSFSDRQETIALKTFGKLFSISRTAIINDDQNAFSEVPRAMGRAAARMVGDEVYDLILNNAALADGTALFHADHGNLTASGAAPSVAQLNAEYSKIALQTDPASNVLNLQARYILVPPQLWGTTRTLLSSALTPGGSNNDNNIWQAELEQVTEPRIGDTGASPAGSAAIWYLMCSSSSVGTVEVGFLDGNQSPYLEQQDGFTRDGAIYKVRLDVGAAVLDHRGLYRNAGA